MVSTFFAFIGGGLFTLYCRPDLLKRMVVSGFIFLGLYFVYFLTLIVIFPGYVERVWNFSVLSRVLILGIPLEELVFALYFGFFWSSVHEHIKRYKIKEIQHQL